MPGGNDHGYATDETRQCEGLVKVGWRRCKNPPLVNRPCCYIHTGPLAEWDAAAAAQREAMYERVAHDMEEARQARERRELAKAKRAGVLPLRPR